MSPLRLIFVLALLFAPGLARAQPPGADHGGATSAPLFVEDLPVGTISVKVARTSVTESIVGAQVVGAWTAPDGKRQSSTAKTGDDGRAVFTDVPVGSSFQAHAVIEGETLTSAEFSVPGAGGTRLLMIVGAQAAEAMNEMTGAAAEAPAEKAAGPVGFRAGKVEGKNGSPAGTVDMRIVGTDGKPAPGIRVSLGHVQHASTDVKFVDAVTDGTGNAHFADLQTGADIEYAAVIQHDGVRLGTDAFTLDVKRGAAGEIRIPARTNNLSALRISSSSRMMVELREDAVGVLQNLIIENTSDKVFDPGPKGLLIPLPDGATGTEKLPGSSEVEIKEGAGVLVHALLPPTQSLAAATQVRIGYVLPTREDRDFEIVQPMPLGLEGGLVLIPGDYTIGLAAPGLRTRPPERDDAGNMLRTFDLEAVPPGQALHLTVHGLPTHDQAGKWIAGVLVGLLILAGIVAASKPRGVPVGEKAW